MKPRKPQFLREVEAEQEDTNASFLIAAVRVARFIVRHAINRRLCKWFGHRWTEGEYSDEHRLTLYKSCYRCGERTEVELF